MSMTPIPHDDPELGQVLTSSHFGRALTQVARDAERIVEIGTWKGLGSTLCLWLGMSRPEQRLWTVEQDGERAAEATRTWRQEPRIEVIHGRTLEVLHRLPAKIDLLLLDGGEEDGWSDFEALEPRARVIALDDTKELKNREARARLMAGGWKVIHDEPADRHGWAIFERLPPTTKGAK